MLAHGDVEPSVRETSATQVVRSIRVVGIGWSAHTLALQSAFDAKVSAFDIGHAI